jgi:hypothetical protein
VTCAGQTSLTYLLKTNTSIETSPLSLRDRRKSDSELRVHHRARDHHFYWYRSFCVLAIGIVNRHSGLVHVIGMAYSVVHSHVLTLKVQDPTEFTSVVGHLTCACGKCQVHSFVPKVVDQKPKGSSTRYQVLTLKLARSSRQERMYECCNAERCQVRRAKCLSTPDTRQILYSILPVQ